MTGKHICSFCFNKPLGFQHLWLQPRSQWPQTRHFIGVWGDPKSDEKAWIIILSCFHRPQKTPPYFIHTLHPAFPSCCLHLFSLWSTEVEVEGHLNQDVPWGLGGAQDFIWCSAGTTVLKRGAGKGPRSRRTTTLTLFGQCCRLQCFGFRNHVWVLIRTVVLSQLFFFLDY